MSFSTSLGKSKAASEQAAKISMKISQSLEGQAYLFKDLPKKLISYLQKDKKIISIRLLTSPLQVFNVMNKNICDFFKQRLKMIKQKREEDVSVEKIIKDLILPENSVSLCLMGLSVIRMATNYMKCELGIDHHQVLLEFQDFFVILGLCHEGLQFISDMDDINLIKRRKDNRVCKQYTGSYSSSKVKNFLLQYEKKSYHLFQWNCQHFATELIKVLTQPANLA